MPSVLRLSASGGEIDAVKEINEAFDEIKDKECLLVSKGSLIYNSADTNRCFR